MAELEKIMNRKGGKMQRLCEELDQENVELDALQN